MKCYVAARPSPNRELMCDECGKQFTKFKATSRAKNKKRNFCSKTCFHRHNRGAQSFAYRGNRRQDRGVDWITRAAEARERDLHICQVCGKPEKKGQKLDVDHIVPFRLVQRNDMVNLLSICKAPCHTSKTTGAENYFLKGDILAFRQKLNQAGWPMEKVNAAIEWWGKIPCLPPELPVKKESSKRKILTHCRRGHARSEHFKTTQRGASRCNACHALKQREYIARRDHGTQRPSREVLMILKSEEKIVSLCKKHPRAVYFDGKICPGVQSGGGIYGPNRQKR